MLVLSRKTRQQIRIGDNITVTILLVKGQVVRVGVDAPRDVRVLRAELPVFDEAETSVPEPRTKVRRSERKTLPDAPSTTPSHVANAATRTSPNLLEIRRRGSLASLGRSNRGTTGALRPLFERH